MKYIVILGALCVAINLSAQQEPKNTNDRTLWNDFTYDMGSVFEGVGFAYSRPLYWDSKDLLPVTGVVGGTTLLYTLDTNIRRGMLNHKEDVPSFITEYGWYAGSPQNNYGLNGAIYLTGLFTKNEKLRRTGVLLISSATATGFLQQLTKSLVGRARPGADLGKRHFKPFGGSARFRSFPSGHAILTFTSAHAIAKQFSNTWAKVGIYTIGIVPGLTRIYADAHWASDVFLSWALSYFVVEAIDVYLDRKYDKKYNNKTGQPAKISLSFGAGGIGLKYAF